MASRKATAPITSTAIAGQAHETEAATVANLSALWSAAYVAVAADRQAGHAYGAISKSWKAAGITPNSDDMVQVFEACAPLADLPQIPAIMALVFPDSVTFPHRVALRAKTRGGIEAVRSSVAAIVAAVANHEGEDEKVAAGAKAMRALRDVKGESRTPGGITDQTEGGGTDEESAPVGPTPTAPTATTLAECLAAIAPLITGAINRIDRGETLTADEAADAHAMLTQLTGRLTGAVSLAG